MFSKKNFSLLCCYSTLAVWGVVGAMPGEALTPAASPAGDCLAVATQQGFDFVWPGVGESADAGNRVPLPMDDSQNGSLQYCVSTADTACAQGADPAVDRVFIAYSLDAHEVCLGAEDCTTAEPAVAGVHTLYLAAGSRTQGTCYYSYQLEITADGQYQRRDLQLSDRVYPEYRSADVPR